MASQQLPPYPHSLLLHGSPYLDQCPSIGPLPPNLLQPGGQPYAAPVTAADTSAGAGQQDPGSRSAPGGQQDPGSRSGPGGQQDLGSRSGPGGQQDPGSGQFAQEELPDDDDEGSYTTGSSGSWSRGGEEGGAVAELGPSSAVASERDDCAQSSPGVRAPSGGCQGKTASPPPSSSRKRRGRGKGDRVCAATPAAGPTSPPTSPAQAAAHALRSLAHHARQPGPGPAAAPNSARPQTKPIRSPSPGPSAAPSPAPTSPLAAGRPASPLTTGRPPMLAGASAFRPYTPPKPGSVSEAPGEAQAQLQMRAGGAPLPAAAFYGSTAELCASPSRCSAPAAASLSPGGGPLLRPRPLHPRNAQSPLGGQPCYSRLQPPLQASSPTQGQQRACQPSPLRPPATASSPAHSQQHPRQPAAAVAPPLTATSPLSRTARGAGDKVAQPAHLLLPTQGGEVPPRPASELPQQAEAWPHKAGPARKPQQQQLQQVGAAATARIPHVGRGSVWSKADDRLILNRVVLRGGPSQLVGVEGCGGLCGQGRGGGVMMWLAWVSHVAGVA